MILSNLHFVTRLNQGTTTLYIACYKKSNCENVATRSEILKDLSLLGSTLQMLRLDDAWN